MTAAHTVAQALREAVEHLRLQSVASARRDAEVLLCHLLGVSRTALIAHPDQGIGADLHRLYFDAVRRRGNREPVAYILGEKEFWSMTFQVSPQVLIPRPETECLVEVCLDQTGPSPPARILEIGTGSGAIVCALAWEIPASRCVATDISPEALAIAAGNIARHGLDQRIELRRGDLFQPISSQEQFDLIVSNPPYLAMAQAGALMPDVRDFEPAIALFAGEDGLAFIRRLVTEAGRHLAPSGILVFEFGAEQHTAIQSLLIASGCTRSSIHRDYAGLPRVATAQWSRQGAKESKGLS